MDKKGNSTEKSFSEIIGYIVFQLYKLLSVNSVTNLTRNHYYTQPTPKQPRTPDPGQLSAVNITNLINDSSRPMTPRQPSKRWTEGMLYRKPRGYRRPRSMGRARHPPFHSPT